MCSQFDTTPHYMYPRVRDLPRDEQDAFKGWLRDQTRPLIDGEPMEEQDAYYEEDYDRWNDYRSGKLMSWVSWD